MKIIIRKRQEKQTSFIYFYYYLNVLSFQLIMSINIIHMEELVIIICFGE